MGIMSIIPIVPMPPLMEGSGVAIGIAPAVVAGILAAPLWPLICCSIACA